MELVYAPERVTTPPLASIFLAGPSPRGNEDYNWRPEAIELLETLEFDGIVFLPIPRDRQWPNKYTDQVDWELRYLGLSTSIVFWVPRDLENLPGFTTNVEFGLFASSGKVTLGFPKDAPKTRYLAHVAKKHDIPVHHTLRETLRSGIEIANLTLKGSW